MAIDWTQMRTAEQRAADALQAARQRIADRRYQAEVAGIVVAGVAIDTGRASQALIAGAALESMLDTAYVLRWKTPGTEGGRVELTAAQVLDVARAVRAHVQAAFDREFALLDALAAGVLTDSMLDEGWPGG